MGAQQEPQGDRQGAAGSHKPGGKKKGKKKAKKAKDRAPQEPVYVPPPAPPEQREQLRKLAVDDYDPQTRPKKDVFEQDLEFLLGRLVLESCAKEDWSSGESEAGATVPEPDTTPARVLVTTQVRNEVLGLDIEFESDETEGDDIEDYAEFYGEDDLEDDEFGFYGDHSDLDGVEDFGFYGDLDGLDELCEFDELDGVDEFGEFDELDEDYDDLDGLNAYYDEQDSIDWRQKYDLDPALLEGLAEFASLDEDDYEGEVPPFHPRRPLTLREFATQQDELLFPKFASKWDELRYRAVKEQTAGLTEEEVFHRPAKKGRKPKHPSGAEQVTPEPEGEPQGDPKHTRPKPRAGKMSKHAGKKAKQREGSPAGLEADSEGPAKPANRKAKAKQREEGPGKKAKQHEESPGKKAKQHEERAKQREDTPGLEANREGPKPDGKAKHKKKPKPKKKHKDPRARDDNIPLLSRKPQMRTTTIEIIPGGSIA